MLFSLLDRYKFGYISHRSLSEWLQESVGFNLNDAEARLIFNRYDRDNDYRISEREFLDEIVPVIQPEDDQQEEVFDEEKLIGHQARIDEVYPSGDDNVMVGGGQQQEEDYTDELNRAAQLRQSDVDDVEEEDDQEFEGGQGGLLGKNNHGLKREEMQRRYADSGDDDLG